MPYDEKRQRYHDLKVWPEFYRDLGPMRKNFEIRFNDRNFQTGDRVHLQEFNPKAQGALQYTGQRKWARIGYVLPLERCPGMNVPSGFVVLGLEFDNE